MLVSWSIGGEVVGMNFLIGAAKYVTRPFLFGSLKLLQSAASLSTHTTTRSPSTTMKYLASLLVLLPLVTAEVAKLKLHKIPQVSQSPLLETAYLASKYGAAEPQLPLMGAGGSGRRLRVDDQGDDLFWTQEEAVKPGHTVPLNSMYLFAPLDTI